VRSGVNSRCPAPASRYRHDFIASASSFPCRPLSRLRRHQAKSISGPENTGGIELLTRLSGQMRALKIAAAILPAVAVAFPQREGPRASSPGADDPPEHSPLSRFPRYVGRRRPGRPLLLSVDTAWSLNQGPARAKRTAAVSAREVSVDACAAEWQFRAAEVSSVTASAKDKNGRRIPAPGWSDALTPSTLRRVPRASARRPEGSVSVRMRNLRDRLIAAAQGNCAPSPARGGGGSRHADSNDLPMRRRTEGFRATWIATRFPNVSRSKALVNLCGGFAAEWLSAGKLRTREE